MGRVGLDRVGSNCVHGSLHWVTMQDDTECYNKCIGILSSLHLASCYSPAHVRFHVDTVLTSEIKISITFNSLCCFIIF